MCITNNDGSKNLTIPESVKHIGTSALYNCGIPEEKELPKKAPEYKAPVIPHIEPAKSISGTALTDALGDVLGLIFILIMLYVTFVWPVLWIKGSMKYTIFKFLIWSLCSKPVNMILEQLSE